MLILENGSYKHRRRQKRWHGLLPVLVRGRYADGRTFKTHTLVDNISDGGFYLQLPHCFLPCERIFGLTRLPGGASLAAHGRIIRLETQGHGLSGLAVRFSNSRLISAPSSN
ncbi:MAG: PilZ domain-containing protein [Candidatus Saccharimonadales bacterium]